MRFVLLLFSTLLVPAFIAGHWWFFETRQADGLMKTVSARLKEAGVQNVELSRKMLDLSVAGTVSGPEVLDRLDASLLTNTPFHLPPDQNRLVAAATLAAKVEGDTLKVSGWLPDVPVRDDVLKRFASIRPDLQLDGGSLEVSNRVSLVDAATGEPRPVEAWIAPLMDGILAPATLSIQRQGHTIRITGLLPEGPLKKALVDAIEASPYDWKVDADGLKTSPYVQDEPFDKPEPLAAFVKSYFDTPAPGSFELGPDGQPKLAGPATHALEAGWLQLLRAVTGPAKVHADFTYHTSIYQLPGGAIQSPLAPDFIDTLKKELAGTVIEFPRGSKIIQPEEATKLAALSSILLTAGPALRLVVGGHPDPNGLPGVEASIARLRAEAVLEFLLEMGIPTTHIEAIAFETTDDASRAGTVEILIQ